MGLTPWVRFTPMRAMNRKLRAAGFAARGLDEAACCQVAADDSDGFISETTVETLAVAHKEKRWRPLVTILCSPSVDRWEAAVVDGENGWLIHDYEEFNYTKEYWEQQIAKKQAAGRASGRARGGTGVQADVQAAYRSGVATDDEANVPTVSFRFEKPKSQKHVASAGAVAESFEQFWRAYPRKVGKPAALRAWKRVPHDEVESVLGNMHSWCTFWTATRTDIKFVPHPATWLNDRRWEDTPPATSSTPRTANGLVMDAYGNLVR